MSFYCRSCKRLDHDFPKWYILAVRTIKCDNIFVLHNVPFSLYYCMVMYGMVNSVFIYSTITLSYGSFTIILLWSEIGHQHVKVPLAATISPCFTIYQGFCKSCPSRLRQYVKGPWKKIKIYQNLILPHCTKGDNKI